MQVALALVLGINRRLVSHLGPEVNLPIPSALSLKIAVGLVLKIDPEVAVTIDFRVPSGVTPGTVPGTVLTVVAGVTA